MDEIKGYILVSDDDKEPNWDGLLFREEPALVYLNIYELLAEINSMFMQSKRGSITQELTIIPLNNKQIAEKLNAGEITF